MREEDFLKAIVASPTDDTPRLVYADWLDEQADPLGEFIRVQCERRQLDERDPRCRELDYRERDLLAHYRNVWAKPIRKWGRVANYGGGFIEEISVRADLFLESGAELLRTAPIRKLKLTHAKNHIEALANCEALAGLESLSLRDNSVGLARFKTLLKSPYISGISHFDFGHNGWAVSSLRELLNAKTIGPLKGLGLDSSKASGEGVRELLASSMMENLERLELSSNQLTDEDLAAIANCPRVKRLRVLTLDFNTNITNAGVRRLFESENLSNLETLSLRSCPLGRHDSDVLFPKKSRLKDLVRLDLSENNLGEYDFGELSDSSLSSGLVHLNMRMNSSFKPITESMLQPERFPELRSLSLSWIDNADALIHGLDCMKFCRLTDLEVWGVFQTEGIQLLAESERFAQLNRLDLSYANVNDAGALALVQSEILNRITELRLLRENRESHPPSEGISAEVVKQLRQRFGKAVCHFS